MLENEEKKEEAQGSQVSESPIKVKPDISQLIQIGVDANSKIYVNWPVDKKELCIMALAEAMKLVATYEQKIVKPAGNPIMNFVRGKK